jgi:hypothetical protein
LSDHDGVEAPWGPEPRGARLGVGPLHQTVAEFARNGRRSTLRLRFTNPKTLKLVDVAVTTGEAVSTEAEHVWHLELQGDIATVSPSIHYVGQFHSGNPATFKIFGVTRRQA